MEAVVSINQRYTLLQGWLLNNVCCWTHFGYTASSICCFFKTQQLTSGLKGIDTQGRFYAILQKEITLVISLLFWAVSLAENGIYS